MRTAIAETCSYAGFLKRNGNGLVLDIAGAEFFLTRESLDDLMSDRMAGVLNSQGDREGIAYLSPIAGLAKTAFTGIVSCHVYTVPYQRFLRVMEGGQRRAFVQEFHARCHLAG